MTLTGSENHKPGSRFCQIQVVLDLWMQDTYKEQELTLVPTRFMNCEFDFACSRASYTLKHFHCISKVKGSKEVLIS